MKLTVKRLVFCAAISAACGFGTPAARADMVLGCQEIGPSNVTCSGTVNTPANPGSTFYGDSFGPLTTISGTTSDFYDDFIFTIGNGTVDALTSSINLGALQGLSNLQVRLYSTTGNPSLPVLGVPNGNVIDAWSSSITYAPGLTGMSAVLPPTTLGAGTYVLEVRGSLLAGDGVPGSSGSYSGVLNLAPVPLPAGLPLLLSGMSALGALIGRRRLSA